jgi:hypothetical protein
LQGFLTTGNEQENVIMEAVMLDSLARKEKWDCKNKPAGSAVA